MRDVLFSLKVGEISEPITVPQGYEIFKVLDELQGSYEQTREFLFKTLSQERLDARRKAYADSLAEQFQLTPDSHGLGILMEILRSGREDPATGKMTFQIPDGAAETPLFRYEGGQIALGEAILQSPVIRQGRDVSDSARVVHFLQRDVIMPQLMWMEADKLELDRELEEWVKRKEEEVLIVTMRQIATTTDEEISQQEVLDYYEETKDQYRTASEVSVVEIQLASEAEAEALLVEVRALFRRASPLIDLLTRIKQKQQDGRDMTEEVQALQEMDDDLEVLEWLRQRLAERGGMETILEGNSHCIEPKRIGRRVHHATIGCHPQSAAGRTRSRGTLPSLPVRGGALWGFSHSGLRGGDRFAHRSHAGRTFPLDRQNSQSAGIKSASLRRAREANTSQYPQGARERIVRALVERSTHLVQR